MFTKHKNWIKYKYYCNEHDNKITEYNIEYYIKYMVIYNI